MIFRDRQRSCGQLFHRILFLLAFWHASLLLSCWSSLGLLACALPVLWPSWPSWSSGPPSSPGSGPPDPLVLWLLALSPFWLLHFEPLCLAFGLWALLRALVVPRFGPLCLASGLCASLQAFVPRFGPLCLTSGSCHPRFFWHALFLAFWPSGMPCFWLSSLLWQHWADYADLLFLNRHHLLLPGTLMRHLLCVYHYPVFGWCPYRMLSSGTLFGMNLQLRLYLVYLTFSILYERRGDRGSYWIHARLFT